MKNPRPSDLFPVAAPLAPGRDQGLTTEEAHARARVEGPNRLPAPERDGLMRAVKSVASQPMVLFLAACVLVYAGLGKGSDSLVLSLSIVAVAVISIYQDARARQVLESLRELASPLSTVVRDGVPQRISSQELVIAWRATPSFWRRIRCAWMNRC